MKTTNNRGMLLESLINQTNIFYLKNKICLVHKKYLDIKFANISKTENNLKLEKAKIISKSTVDYYGIYQGKFLAFEAKSTESKTFSLRNIKSHQIEYLDLISLFSGIAFWIIYFKIQNKFLLIKHDKFKKISENKKSLSFEEIKENGKFIDLQFPGILDYISQL
ncbi:Holliday junction resolvase RecU [Metamycoplasma buccale]|uniref:Holliday junction resolvase RecU n=1 Tax=Metamycoplasma buccale TaxID=55602 RepID=UPI00398E54EB